LVATDGVVTRWRRGRTVVRCEFSFVPETEELVPGIVVVCAVPLLRALLVGEGDQHSIDSGIELVASHRKRRDRDPPALSRHPPGTQKSGSAG
jgi:hypothetical protein